MAGVKGNRRILYTKNVLKESLLELLEDKEIYKITVTDICKKADINRGTFYTHYKDAFDLLESIENEFFNELTVYIENYNENSLLKMLYLIKENKDLCKIIFCKQKESKIIDKALYLANKIDVENMLQEKNRTHIDYLIKYAIGGIFAIIQNWLNNGLIESPEEILYIIESAKKLNYG